MIGINERYGDPRAEQAYSAEEIAKRIAPYFGRVSRATVARWMLKGVGGIKLRSRRAGRTPVAEWRWVLEFLRARNPGLAGDALSMPLVIEERAAAADKALDLLQSRR